MHKEGGRKVGEGEGETQGECCGQKGGQAEVPGGWRVATANEQVPQYEHAVVVPSTLGRQVAKREADPGPTQADQGGGKCLGNEARLQCGESSGQTGYCTS